MLLNHAIIQMSVDRLLREKLGARLKKAEIIKSQVDYHEIFWCVVHIDGTILRGKKLFAISINLSEYGDRNPARIARIVYRAVKAAYWTDFVLKMYGYNKYSRGK